MRITLRGTDGVMFFATDGGLAAHKLLEQVMLTDPVHVQAKDPKKHTIYKMTQDVVFGMTNQYKLYLWEGTQMIVNS